MTLLFRSIFIGILAYVLGTLSNLRAEPLVQNAQKVAFVGDSITAYGAMRPGGYVKLVAAGLESQGVKINVIPAGVRGSSSNDMLPRVEAMLAKDKPDWMTLSCGVNDVWHGVRGVNLENYQKNISAMVDKAQSAGTKVMILTSTAIFEDPTNDLNSKLAPYNDFLRTLAKERNLPLADLNAAFWEFLKANPPSAPDVNVLTLDGVHMNPRGNILMASEILRAFGLPADAVSQLKKTWMDAPDAGFVLGELRTDATTAISLPAYDALDAMAREKKLTLEQCGNFLLLEALREVLNGHGHEAIEPNQLKTETQQAFDRQITKLVEKQGG